MRVPSPERASLVGSIVWVVGITVLELGQAPSLVVLSPLVLHPLIIGLANTEAVAPRLHTLVRWVQLPAAALLAVGLGQPEGPLAAALALPWFVVTSLTALLGLLRCKQRGFLPTHELSIDAGLMLLAGGGAWAVASCAGYPLLGFSDTIVLLAAAHFHYTAFVLPVLAGLGVRRLDRPYTRWIPVPILAGYPLVAAGITASPIVEVVGAIVLAVGAIGSAVVQLAVAAAAKHRVASLLLACSALALLWGISLAVTYAVGEFRGLPWPSIPEMVQLHGSVNALGFGLLGTWAWTLEARRSG